MTGDLSDGVTEVLAHMSLSRMASSGSSAGSGSVCAAFEHTQLLSSSERGGREWRWGGLGDGEFLGGWGWRVEGLEAAQTLKTSVAAPAMMSPCRAETNASCPARPSTIPSRTTANALPAVAWLDLALMSLPRNRTIIGTIKGLLKRANGPFGHLVHDRPSSCVDQERSVFHLGKSLRAHHPFRLIWGAHGHNGADRVNENSGASRVQAGISI